MTLFSAVMLPFFTEWAHISLFQVQLLQSWFSMWIFVLEVPTGVVADRWGRKWSVLLGALIWALGALVYASAPAFVLFLLAEFLMALAASLISGADKALIYDFLKEKGQSERAKSVFGKAHSMQMMSMLIAAPLGSWIAQSFGLQYPVLLTSIPLFVAALIALSFTEPKYHAESETLRYKDIVKRGLQITWGNPTLRALATDMTIVAAGGYFFHWYYQATLTAIDLEVKYFGLFTMLSLLSQIVVANNFERLEKFFGSTKRYLRFTTLATAFGFFLVALWPTVATVVVMVVLIAGFGFTRSELISVYLNKQLESAQRATALSFINMFRRLLLAFLNPVFGYLATGSLSLAIVLAGGLALSSLFIKLEDKNFEA